MLRAGLIGLPSAGKTTLFQLLTSAREAPRTHGKTEANVGVSRVPDDRLDRLTALFKPEKRVPATVEFADMAAGRGDAKSLLDVVGVPQRGRPPPRRARVQRSVRSRIRSQSVDPARDVRTIEEELILADLGVVERRLERLEKDLKKSAVADLARERDVLVQCRAWLEDGRALRTLGLDRRRRASVARFSVPVGEAASARSQCRRVGRRGRRRCGAPHQPRERAATAAPA